jgi:hypothetical protein
LWEKKPQAPVFKAYSELGHTSRCRVVLARIFSLFQ